MYGVLTVIDVVKIDVAEVEMFGAVLKKTVRCTLSSAS